MYARYIPLLLFSLQGRYNTYFAENTLSPLIILLNSLTVHKLFLLFLSMFNKVMKSLCGREEEFQT